MDIPVRHHLWLGLGNENAIPVARYLGGLPLSTFAGIDPPLSDLIALLVEGVAPVVVAGYANFDPAWYLVERIAADPRGFGRHANRLIVVGPFVPVLPDDIMADAQLSAVMTWDAGTLPAPPAGGQP